MDTIRRHLRRWIRWLLVRIEEWTSDNLCINDMAGEHEMAYYKEGGSKESTHIEIDFRKSFGHVAKGKQFEVIKRAGIN